MNRRIVRYPELAPTECVEFDYSEAHKQIIADLIDTSRVNACSALSAPQIGFDVQAIVIDARQLEASWPADDYIAILNPTIQSSSPDIATSLETCPSLPGFSIPIDRPASCTISYKDIQSSPACVGLTSHAATEFQHAYEILHGTYFLDHASDIRKRMIEKKLLKRKKREIQAKYEREREYIEDLKGEEAAERFDKRFRRQQLALKLNSRR